jgi:hypothetical protein
MPSQQKHPLQERNFMAVYLGKCNMPLLALIFGLLLPRVTIAFLWFFTHWFDRAFSTTLWPLLGFLFLPLTLLWYSAVQNWFGGQWTAIPIIGMVIAVLLDLSPTRARRRRRAEVEEG